LTADIAVLRNTVAMSDVLITDITALLVHYGVDDDYDLCTLYDPEWSKYAVEAGNRETSSKDADTSECNVHQFIAKDEARDPMGSDDIEADAAQKDVHVHISKTLSKQDAFGTVDVPPPDDFRQQSHKRSKQHIKNDADNVHQFIAKDEARDPMGSDDSEADAAHKDAHRSKTLSKQDAFGTVDMPPLDDVLQKSHKRSKKHIKNDEDEDNVRQFIAKDEARSDDSETDAA